MDLLRFSDACVCAWEPTSRLPGSEEATSTAVHNDRGDPSPQAVTPGNKSQGMANEGHGEKIGSTRASGPSSKSLGASDTLGCSQGSVGEDNNMVAPVGVVCSPRVDRTSSSATKLNQFEILHRIHGMAYPSRLALDERTPHRHAAIEVLLVYKVRDEVAHMYENLTLPKVSDRESTCIRAHRS